MIINCATLPYIFLSYRCIDLLSIWRSDLITDLGSNVSINDENEVHWILLKTADPPACSFLLPISPSIKHSEINI